MRIQFDTTSKSIKVEANVKISELLNVLKKLFPNDEWKGFTLETNVYINNWSSPIIIERRPAPITYPWYCSSEGQVAASYKQLNNGVFNVECKAGDL